MTFAKGPHDDIYIVHSSTKDKELDKKFTPEQLKQLEELEEIAKEFWDKFEVKED